MNDSNLPKDEAAFEALLKQLRPVMEKTARRWLRDQVARDDVLQVAALDLWKLWKPEEPTEGWAALAKTIVYRKVVEWLRRSTKWIECISLEKGDAATPDPRENLEMHSELRMAISKLDREDRLLFLGKYRGASWEEISRETNASERTLQRNWPKVFKRVQDLCNGSRGDHD